MILQELLSPPALVGTVHSITVLRVEHLPDAWNIPLVAKAMPSVVYQRTGAGAKLWLYGQNVAPILVRASGQLMMIAWFLQPHRLRPLFGLRADEVTDRCIPLDDWPRVREMGLVERLALADDLSGQLRLMEEFIVGLCAVARDGNRVAGYAARAIATGDGRMLLGSLREELRITERSLQRLFAEHVGVSPKVYSRICQFQPAFRQLKPGAGCVGAAI